MVKEIYTRKLSTTEVKEGYILILKDKLRFFPEPGGRLTSNSRTRSTTRGFCLSNAPARGLISRMCTVTSMPRGS